MTSEIPKAGEWWLTSWGPIVYVVGRMFGRGIIVQYRDESTQAIKKTEGLSEWRRLPDDAGFDWKEPQPITFPKWFSHNLTSSRAGDVAFVKRTSIQKYVCVSFDGDEQEYDWTETLDEWIKSGKWTEITEAEAVATLTEASEPQNGFTDRETEFLAALANLRDNMDRLATRVVNLEQRTLPYQTIGGSLR